MPATGQGSGTGSPPINILIGPPGGSPAMDVTNRFDLSTITIEETGNQEGATFDGSLWDRSQAFAFMRAEWQIYVQWKNPVTKVWESMFRGFIRTPSAEAYAIYGELAVHAEDCGTLMDRGVLQVAATRKAGESDKARIQWLFNHAEGRDHVTVGQPLTRLGMVDWSRVKVLNANMDKQTFAARLTIRQALERILSQASDDDTADYFLDHEPRLWTFDSGHPIDAWDSPYDIHSTHAPAAGRIAPEGLTVEWDSDNLWTGYQVTGAHAKVSRTYLDSDPFSATAAKRLATPYGVVLWGRRIGNISAPDADTDKKVQRVVRAALRDTRNPVPRVSFTVSGTSCYDSGGKRWRGGQRFYVTSQVHGLNGAGADGGDWAGGGLQPFRVKSVTTRFLSGAGDMEVNVTAGGRRKVLYQGGA